jgi:uncharacterized membrane protein
VSVSVSRLAESDTTKRSLHPLHAFLLAGAAYFFVGGLLSDWAYFSTHEIQWKNFAMWLIMGGLVCAGFTIMWAFADFIRAEKRGRHVVYLLLILAAFILEFINELIHAKDAWASMPDALIVSGIAAVLVVVATGLGLSTWTRAER